MSDQGEQKRPLTTTGAGSPAPSDDTSLTVGAGGPNLLQDRYLNEKLADAAHQSHGLATRMLCEEATCQL